MKRNRINHILLTGIILVAATSSLIASEPLRHQAFVESLRKSGPPPGDKIAQVDV